MYWYYTYAHFGRWMPGLENQEWWLPDNYYYYVCYIKESFQECPLIMCTAQLIGDLSGDLSHENLEVYVVC